MFRNRTEAGRSLLRKVYAMSLRDPLVLGIPRGGVVVAAEVAKGLKCPLDIIIPRKIGAPHNPELAIGAVAQDGTLILDEAMVNVMGVGRAYIENAVSSELREIARRVKVYRGTSEPARIKSRDVIVVDDGIATGLTITAALRSVRQGNPAQIILAVPVAPRDTLSKIAREVDRLVCLASPEPFLAVGEWYLQFEQVSDEEVLDLLRITNCVKGETSAEGKSLG